MSFYFGILVAVPNEEEFEIPKLPGRASGQKVRRLVWRVEEVLDLSTLKLSLNDPSFKEQTKRRRAKTYLLDVLWPHISKIMAGRKLEFAPKFIQYTDDFIKFPNKFPGDMLMPWRGILNKPIPWPETMQAHNLALESPLPKDFDELGKFSGTPCPWLPCGDLVPGTVTKKLAMVEDIDAVPYLRLWTTMFQQLDKVGGRAILLIHFAALSTFENTGDF